MSAELAIAAAVGYLAGSIPFGLIFTRLAGLGDIRSVGSGNIGATNVLRSGNKALAATTLLFDGGKGAAAVLAVHGLLGVDAGLIAGLASVVGHNFPVWLRFRGGKGVATTLGVLFGVAWPVGLVACLVWLAAAFLFRFSSLAALIALGTSPFTAWWLADQPVAWLAALLALLAFVRHRANIRRLIEGNESKIGGAKNEPSSAAADDAPP